MVRLIGAVVFSLGVWSVGAAAAGDGQVQVEISGLQEASGELFIAVYDSEDDWLGEKVVQQQKVTIAEARREGIVYTALQLPAGEYALSIFYDANGNGELDTNFIGIPKEPVAMSNNAKGKFGPPKYRDARFTLGAEPVVQKISMVSID